ncbi:hypothetical protein BGX30_000783 [Mortierella sp. GBA39]|nr:hypothetical protein BGX30_000783 [Mortierella sp. GBA39]
MPSSFIPPTFTQQHLHKKAFAECPPNSHSTLQTPRRTNEIRKPAPASSARDISLLKDSIESSQYCLDVLASLGRRRKEFAINSEPYPPTVESYMDTAYGGRIVPRINENGARLHYCLKDDQFRNLHHIIVRSVRTSRDPYEVRLYDEKAVLIQARRIHGGDVGIANARQFVADQGERVELPPVGPVLERRNKIRQAFLMRKVYASSMLPQVRDYVKTGRGNFEEIVDTLAV